MPGSRHGAFCAIGGFLARCGLTGPEVKLFAGAITAAGGFDRDHIGHATDAAEAHHSGKHSYGYKTIAEVFDEKVATKAAEWLGYKSGSGEEKDGAVRRGPSQTDILLELAQSAELFHSSDGTGFADLHINGHRETWRLRAKGFRLWLLRCFFEKTGGAPTRLLRVDRSIRLVLVVSIVFGLLRVALTGDSGLSGVGPPANLYLVAFY